VENKHGDAHPQSDETTSGNKLGGLLDSIPLDPDALLQDIEVFMSFPKRSKWHEMLIKYKDHLALMAFLTLYWMDETYGSANKISIEKELLKDKTVLLEPLNRFNQNRYRLYHTSVLTNYGYRLNNRPVNYRGSSLKVILSHFNIVELTSDYDVELRFTSDADLKKLGMLRDNHAVRIAFSHLASGKFYTSINKKNQFFITGLSDDALAKERIFNTLDAMDKEGAHIAVFPEMTCTSTLKKAILDEKIESLRHIKLIILGSTWENRENKSTVLTGSGAELYSQSKLNAFHNSIDFTSEGSTEGLDLSGIPRTIKLLEIPGFGRISNIICVDYLIDEIRDICLSLGVDFFFSPLFTGKIDLFESRAKAMSAPIAFLADTRQRHSPVPQCFIRMQHRKPTKALPILKQKIVSLNARLRKSQRKQTFASIRFAFRF
jgi:hypothetical protein